MPDTAPRPAGSETGAVPLLGASVEGASAGGRRTGLRESTEKGPPRQGMEWGRPGVSLNRK